MTRILCASAILNAREGQTQEVVTCIMRVLTINEAFRGKQALIIEYLNSLAVIRMSLANLRQALYYCQLNEAELRQLDSAISHLDPIKSFQQALQGERVFFLQQTRKVGVFWLTKGDTLAYLDLFARQIKNARLTYSDAKSEGLLGTEAQNQIPFYAVITRIMSPSLLRTNIEHYKCEADIACAQAFLALHAYRGKFGRFPRSLAELKSGIEWEMPADPFTGRDLIYKPQQEGFILYSVGPDQKDDGGIDLQRDDKTIQSGDIVWRMDH